MTQIALDSVDSESIDPTIGNAKLAKLVVISGPSGVGKSTVVRKVLETCSQPITLSVSATTRSARPGEVAGKHYHFVSDRQFQDHLAKEEFLEHAEVFGRGHWYGTLKEPVIQNLKDGVHVILEIDVQGAKNVLESCPEAMSIFVHPGSLDELERRLRGRKTEKEMDIQRRLEVARNELEQADIYRHCIVNQDVDQTAKQICDWICS